ncbi:zinc-binding alcohol dehydrogenase family protein [Staphylococcus caeli]|uniref:Zinc-binding alcohol dehydrogenase family protein n=1 Tax=Staphylococcus caeli TaxID=2201815 RepID=A0A1D4NPC4_9STAP|nr:zinc-binding alcohol dehydrogenase family protein [Staphylococcus caeli]AWM30256.1 hypothetical protein SCC82B_00116 [Staphylococcus caeli]SCT12503.1 zinc-binding alcohol dehydrogenase family protein [Staphylococcus caeli]SCT51134.1 zinc-binding alcohol dehydrogenase family protein [Staphylococcus caeli]
MNLNKDDNIIIHGTNGGVGHLAIQFAKCTTNNVIGIASREDGISLCKSYGINSINGKTRLKTLNFSIYNKMLLTTSLDEYVQHVLNMKQPTTIAYYYRKTLTQISIYNPKFPTNFLVNR